MKSYLREKQILLLLDNFEQVLDAAQLVAELLAAAHRLKVLVTSRAALHLYGEHEFAVPPLALPDRGSMPTLERLAQYEAVRLFIDRAQAIKSDFAVTNANAPAVAKICYRLDGLPLAIELAAARIKLFPPEALLARLSNRLTLLTGGPRDLPARQQTLRSTIDWSYDLLSPQAQALFRRLGVFVGGCTLEAAETICAELSIEQEESRETAHKNPFLHSSFSILHSVETLVDQSLLRQEEGVDGEPRFVMLETVREYALERLAENGEDAVLRQRHAEYFVALAEMAEPELRGPRQRVWLDRLDRGLPNLRAAIGWAIEVGKFQIAVRIGAALEVFWYLREHIREGIGWLERALAGSSLLPPVLRAKALHMLGRLLWEVETPDSFVRARALLQESLGLYRDLQDATGIAGTLADLGVAVNDSGGDSAEATAFLEESLTLFRSLGSKQGIGDALHWLGYVAISQEQYALARTHSEESLALRRETGDAWGVAWSLFILGVVARNQGDIATAITFNEERLTIESWNTKAGSAPR